MRKRIFFLSLFGILGLCLLAGIAYNLPPIHERLAWRVDNLRVGIRRYLNPPEEAVFIPQEQVDAIVDATLTAMAPTSTPTLPAGPTGTPLPSATPTLIPTPIPESITLNGIRHEYQKFNNCAPASLSMVLSYWGWEGDQIGARAYLRPNFEVDDKNVNAFEIVDFVETQTDLDAVWRVGGDLQLLKRLLAAGFPVLIEKGLEPHVKDWMGHYQVISGYNDAKGKFLVYDSYEGPPEAYGITYESMQFWRHFNFVYVVIFPPERAAEVQSILGSNSDPLINFQLAAELALQETSTLNGREQFFAWFNRGTNLVYLQDYAGAAQAYDTAFATYATLSEEERPWRMLWYQDGPYAAYYYTGRYQDVISLAKTTLSSVDKPVLEETYYWRGMAKAALGDKEGALEDLNRALALNPKSTPAGDALQRLNSQ
ncbi:MAG TPA: C39 family peptidase [Anaerolineales bacterium]|nr:C39 family peptidase [Anaerolineales bacterium]